MIRFLAQLRFTKITFSVYRRRSIVGTHKAQFTDVSKVERTQKLSLAKRAKNFWNENPFTQIALLVCVLVVGVATAVEWAQNKRKGSKFKHDIVFHNLPVKPLHSLYRLDTEIDLLQNEISNKFAKSRVVSVVGERGSGKTELARQFAENLIDKNKESSRFHRLYKPDYYVMTIDMSSRDSVLESLLKSASLLRIPSSEVSVNFREVTDENISALLASINECARKKQIICIMDNVESLQDYEAITSNKSWKVPFLTVVTSRRSLDGKFNLEINLNSSKLGLERLKNWIMGFGFIEKECIKIAESVNCIPNNFQVKSLICHTLHLVKQLTGKCEFNFINFGDLQSVSNSLQQQLPQELRNDVNRLGISSRPPLSQLQLIELILLISSTRVSQHSVDLLAKLSPACVLPVTTLISYLQTPLLELDEQLRANTTQIHDDIPALAVTEKQEADMGYWEYIKHTWNKRQQMIELMKQQQRPKEYRSDFPVALTPLKESPLFHWEHDASNGFQGVKFRSKEIHSLAADFFENKTLPQLEQIEISRGKALHSSSLLSKLSTFNPTLHLQKYRANLPGISKSVSQSDPMQIHRLSFIHRILRAVATDFEKNCEISHPADVIKCRMLANHGEYLLARNEYILLTDRVTGLKLRAAKFRQTESLQSAVTTLREVADIQESTQVTLVELANTYSQLGKLYLLLGQNKNGLSYYQQAAGLYERAISKLTSAQRMEHASLLYSYGVELGYERELEKSKSCLERSISVLNLAGAQISSTQQQQLQHMVLSTMIELAHVYVSLGAINYAGRMLNMAENLSKNLSPEEIPDLAQLYNLKALVKGLTGDKKAYSQLKQRAGDVLARVNDKPFVY